jgi:hypothetical protein
MRPEIDRYNEVIVRLLVEHGELRPVTRRASLFSRRRVKVQVIVSGRWTEQNHRYVVYTWDNGRGSMIQFSIKPESNGFIKVHFIDSQDRHGTKLRMAFLKKVKGDKRIAFGAYPNTGGSYGFIDCHH